MVSSRQLALLLWSVAAVRSEPRQQKQEPSRIDRAGCVDSSKGGLGEVVWVVGRGVRRCSSSANLRSWSVAVLERIEGSVVFEVILVVLVCFLIFSVSAIAFGTRAESPIRSVRLAAVGFIPHFSIRSRVRAR